MTSSRRPRPSRKRSTCNTKNDGPPEVCTGDSTTTSSMSSDISTGSTPSIDTTEPPHPSLNIMNSSSTAIIKNDDNSDAVLRVPFNSLNISGSGSSSTGRRPGAKAWNFTSKGNIPSQATTSLTTDDSKTGDASSNDDGTTESYDFIGPSSAMKNLFSLPYTRKSDGDVTVALHNLGNGTLLLDNGEYASLLQNFESAEADERSRFDGRLAHVQLSPKLLEQERSQRDEINAEEKSKTLALPPALALDALSHALTDATKTAKLAPNTRQSFLRNSVPDNEFLVQNDTDTMSDVASVTIPQYQQTVPFKFHEMNMLLSSDTIIVRPPPTNPGADESNDFCRSARDQPSMSPPESQSVSIKVAEISDIKHQVEAHLKQVEEAERNKFSYAQMAAKNIDFMLQASSVGKETTNMLESKSKDSKQEQVSLGKGSVNAEFPLIQPVVSHHVSHDQLQSYLLPSPPVKSTSFQQKNKEDVAFLQSTITAPQMTSPNSSLSEASIMSPVMTCLDAYLDNIMTNVPQLALCLAEKGFVQAVKLLRTEDIPSNMIHSSTVDMVSPITSSQMPTAPQESLNSSTSQKSPPLFNPSTVDMNATMLLRYLKQHCSSPNSTYLLHRSSGMGDGESKDPDTGANQAIHLYDITALSQKRQRQWTWWLAMMSYKFALSLQTHLKSSDELKASTNTNSSYFSPGIQRELRNRQRSLLTTSIELLEEIADMDGVKHETICATLNEHLADTFLWNSQPASPQPPGNCNSDVSNKTKSDLEQPTDSSSITPPVSVTADAPSAMKLSQLVLTPHDEYFPYKDIGADGLSKAQQYLINAVKILEPVLRNAKRRRRKTDGQEESSNRLEAQAIEAQLFKLHVKLVHVSLRLTARHFEKYFSSSVMQSIRLSARHLAKSADLLSSMLEASGERTPQRESMPPLSGKGGGLLTNGQGVEAVADNDSVATAYSSSKKKSKDAPGGNSMPTHTTKTYSAKEKELVDNLLSRYQWLWQHCGFFARLFCGDAFWRDKGHISGEDVVTLLQNVETECSKWHYKFVSPSTNAARNSDDTASCTSREDESCRGSVTSQPDRNCEFFNFDEALQHAGPHCGISPDQVPHLSLCNLDMLVYDPVRSKDEETKLLVGKEAADCFLKTLPVMKRERELVMSAAMICYQKANMANLLADTCNEKSKQLLHSARDLAAVTSACPCSITGKELLRTKFSKEKGVEVDECMRQCTECLLQSTELSLLTGLYSFSKQESSLNAKNAALLRCNISHCYKIRSTSSLFLQNSNSTIQMQIDHEKTGDARSSPAPDINAEKWLQKSIDYLQAAHTGMVERNSDNSQIWDYVSDELAATFLILGVRRRQMLLGSGGSPVVLQSLRLTPGKERSVVHPMEQALKIYEGLANAHQVAAVHYQMALYYSKVWTCQRDETKTRDKLSCAFQHFSTAHKYFFNEMRGNEETFVLLTLDLSNLYSMVSGPDCISKALSCCFDALDAFSPHAIQAALARRATMPSSAKVNEKNAWFEKMKTLSTNVENRIMKLLVLLVKLEKEADPKLVGGSRFKDMYRVALTTKMATAASKKDKEEVDYQILDTLRPAEASADQSNAGIKYDVYDLLNAVKECYDKHYPIISS